MAEAIRTDQTINRRGKKPHRRPTPCAPPSAPQPTAGSTTPSRECSLKALYAPDCRHDVKINAPATADRI